MRIMYFRFFLCLLLYTSCHAGFQELSQRWIQKIKAEFQNQNISPLQRKKKPQIINIYIASDQDNLGEGPLNEENKENDPSLSGPLIRQKKNLHSSDQLHQKYEKSFDDFWNQLHFMKSDPKNQCKIHSVSLENLKAALENALPEMGKKLIIPDDEKTIVIVKPKRDAYFTDIMEKLSTMSLCTLVACPDHVFIYKNLYNLPMLMTDPLQDEAPSFDKIQKTIKDKHVFFVSANVNQENKVHEKLSSSYLNLPLLNCPTQSEKNMNLCLQYASFLAKIALHTPLQDIQNFYAHIQQSLISCAPVSHPRRWYQWFSGKGFCLQPQNNNHHSDACLIQNIDPAWILDTIAPLVSSDRLISGIKKLLKKRPCVAQNTSSTIFIDEKQRFSQKQLFHLSQLLEVILSNDEFVFSKTAQKGSFYSYTPIWEIIECLMSDTQMECEKQIQLVNSFSEKPAEEKKNCIKEKMHPQSLSDENRKTIVQALDQWLIFKAKEILEKIYCQEHEKQRATFFLHDKPEKSSLWKKLHGFLSRFFPSRYLSPQERSQARLEKLAHHIDALQILRSNSIFIDPKKIFSDQRSF